jgi:hypothetical protein
LAHLAAEFDAPGKCLASRYSSGPSRNWVKTKCRDWKRINAERWRIFEGPRKPELPEAQKTLAKKREELARVRASLSQAKTESSGAAVVGGDRGLEANARRRNLA